MIQKKKTLNSLHLGGFDKFLVKNRFFGSFLFVVYGSRIVFIVCLNKKHGKKKNFFIEIIEISIMCVNISI